MSCKHRLNKNNRVYCLRDGSWRTKGCPCPCYEPTWWERFCKWLKKNK